MSLRSRFGAAGAARSPDEPPETQTALEIMAEAHAVLERLSASAPDVPTSGWDGRARQDSNPPTTGR